MTLPRLFSFTAHSQYNHRTIDFPLKTYTKELNPRNISQSMQFQPFPCAASLLPLSYLLPSATFKNLFPTQNLHRKSALFGHRLHSGKTCGKVSPPWPPCMPPAAPPPWPCAAGGGGYIPPPGPPAYRPKSPPPVWGQGPPRSRSSQSCAGSSAA